MHNICRACRPRRRKLPAPNKNNSAKAKGFNDRPGVGLDGVRPDAVAAAVSTVRVTVCDPPLASIIDGEKVAVAPEGNPLTEKFIAPA